MSCVAGALCAFLALSKGGVERPVNFGGTNHWVYDHGTADAGNTNNSWYLPALNLRTTVATMEHDLALVHQQMQALRASGQTAYVIPVWNTSLAWEWTTPHDGLPDGVWGNVIDHSSGIMHPQHRANLKQLVTWAVDLGFERIVVRFFYNGNPETWQTWCMPYYYETIRDFLFDARKAALEAFTPAAGKGAPSHPVMLFDLGGEQAGIDEGMMGPFIQQLWTDYTSSYGVDDTVGFSFAWAPGRFTTQLGWLSATGVLPKRWAFDVYGNVGEALQQIHAEMGPLRNQPIDIMETHWNDPGTAAQIGAALDSMPLLNIDSLMQWTVAPGETHFTPAAVAAQNTTTTFTSYAPLLAQRRVYVTSDDADVMGFSNTTCDDPKNLLCNVDLYWSDQPKGQYMHAYVYGPLGRQYVACGGPAGVQPLDWVQEQYVYDFEAYLTTEPCLDPNPPVVGTPVARGRIHF